MSDNLDIPVTQTQSGTCPQGNAYQDGCPAAPTPAGAIQYPTKLNGYSFRPPWNVPGVDYYVGKPNDGITLTDFRTLNGTGPWTFNTGQLRCNSPVNVTLDHYDFTTASNNWYFPGGGCTGLTITNSKFGCNFEGANIQSTINLTFISNTFDYSACKGDGDVIRFGDLNCSLWLFVYSEIQLFRKLAERRLSYRRQSEIRSKSNTTSSTISRSR